MTRQDKYDEVRRDYKAIESFIAKHVFHPQAQDAYDALDCIKTYVVGLELQIDAQADE